MKNEIEIIFKNGAKIKTKYDCVHTVDDFIQIEISSNHHGFISIAKDEVLIINTDDINLDDIFTPTPKSESFYEGWSKRSRQVNEFEKLNIDSILKVKLTDYGLILLREQHNKVNRKFHHKLEKYYPITIDINGYYYFKLWDLLKLFEGHIEVECQKIFCDIIIIGKDLREV